MAAGGKKKEGEEREREVGEGGKGISETNRSVAEKIGT